MQLAWEQPQTISEVVLKFDSGFQRELTLSASDTVSRGVLRQPQPETVRDYSVAVRSESGWTAVAEVRGNHQRLNRVRFPAAKTRVVRIEVTKMNGAEPVRLFEVRCYA